MSRTERYVKPYPTMQDASTHHFINNILEGKEIDGGILGGEVHDIA